ncbi:DUF6634 family protein [Roseococcus sp. DSY-14]|uniref:DUF6634 family protein n=1 Tax=Roseococcus sp. DSY-14 TaxID=3369650 RepID=UPI00387B4D26
MPITLHLDAPARCDRLLRDTAARYEALAADLRRLADAAAPTPAELGAAPLLEDWSWSPRTALTLTGTVQDHPVLADGPIRTSAVLVHSPSQSWVRTLSRWYVLGCPAGQDAEARRG